MDNDIVPALLEKIKNEFSEQTINSQKLKSAFSLLKNRKATYKNVNEFAIEIGEILANVLGSNINIDILPDGKMYFNIADRLLNETLKNNYDLISNFAIDVQEQLNKEAAIKIKGQKPDFNQDRVNGLVNKISAAEDFDSVKWVLGEPIVNFSQSVVDDVIKANVDFHAKSGLRPRINRTLVGHACDWCRKLAGSFDYYDLPDDIYRRHERCKCIVEYKPGDGRKQNVWSKTWSDPQREQKIQNRKSLNLRKDA